MHLTINEKHSQLKSQVLHKGYVKIEWNIMKRCNIIIKIVLVEL